MHTQTYIDPSDQLLGFFQQRAARSLCCCAVFEHHPVLGRDCTAPARCSGAGGWRWAGVQGTVSKQLDNALSQRERGMNSQYQGAQRSGLSNNPRMKLQRGQKWWTRKEKGAQMHRWEKRRTWGLNCRGEARGTWRERGQLTWAWWAAEESGGGPPRSFLARLWQWLCVVETNVHSLCIWPPILLYLGSLGIRTVNFSLPHKWIWACN